ncbi:hypothetical protein SCORR_v1c08220 [Spiroplasma corruscae]|uniref:Transmembrane protein n=1 Tax=Spiroplasma corruscae TaxID=216934 RepID=A0A222EQS3_9MOLU|nr:energy-coupled thiamine transporter ThiT [Spiroplasma corruscae]ASP28594.1 hypothetical protein SCORR_v1c08220 [Spiroplasma corruscae]
MENKLNVKTNKLFWFTTIFSTLRFSLLLVGIIFLVINLLDAKIDIYENNTVYQESMDWTKRFTIILIFFLLITIYLILIINSLLNYIYNNNDTKINLFGSLVALNFEVFIYFLQRIKFNKVYWTKPRISIMDISTISILLALFIIIDIITTGFIPPFPFFIQISIKYLVLFFGCYLLSFTKSLILCMMCAFVTLVNPGTVKLTFFQFFFDYWLPATLIATSCFFKPSVKKSNKVVRAFSWFNFIIIPIIILYFSRVISGIIFWLNPVERPIEEITYEFRWNSTVAYSFIYNSFATVVDFVTIIILLPSICTSLDFIRVKYFTTITSDE